MSGPWQNTVPVTVDDIQRRLGPKPQDPTHPLFPSADEWAAIRARGNSPAGRATARLSDIGARTQDAVDALRSTIGDVAAHPARPTNAFQVAGSMANLAPTLLATPLAAGIDNLTAPVTRAYNNAFGGQVSPREPTDNMLNAAGFVLGPGEIKAGLKAVGEAALALPALPLIGQLTGKTLPELTALRAATAPAAAASQADNTLAYIHRVDPRLMDKPHFMPDNQFADTVQLAGDNLGVGLPKWAKNHYDDVIDDAVRGPILDDPDFSGFSHREVGDALSTLKAKAFEYRQDPANVTGHRVADAWDQVHDEMVAMVDRNRAGLAPVKPEAPTLPPVVGQSRGGPAYLGDTSGGAMVRDLPVRPGPISSFSPDIEAMLPPIGDPTRADKIGILKMVMGASNDLTTWKQFLANPDQFQLPAGLADTGKPGVQAVSPTFAPQAWTPTPSND